MVPCGYTCNPGGFQPPALDGTPGPGSPQTARPSQVLPSSVPGTAVVVLILRRHAHSTPAFGRCRLPLAGPASPAGHGSLREALRPIPGPVSFPDVCLERGQHESALARTRVVESTVNLRGWKNSPKSPKMGVRGPRRGPEWAERLFCHPEVRDHGFVSDLGVFGSGRHVCAVRGLHHRTPVGYIGSKYRILRMRYACLHTVDDIRRCV